VVSDLIGGRPISFGGKDRSERSVVMFYDCRGNARNEHAPGAAIWFDKSHLIRLSGSARDDVHKSERPKIALPIIQ
jgi:hypothetical protein